MSEKRAEIGQPAPDFEGEAVRWNPRKKEFEYLAVNLAQNRKHSLWTVLFFYPRDFSGLCPTEIHAFNRRLADFEQAGAQDAPWARGPNMCPVPLFKCCSRSGLAQDTKGNNGNH